MADDRLDIVIFGATGSTGKFVVKNATHICKDLKMKFGIAGRKKEALEAVVKEFASDIEAVPLIHIILADIKDEESLKKMTAQAKILINCVGPYRFYGEPVIKACIATHTHYVDITGEEEFMEKMQLEYNEAAKEAGVYVISACGFDCIPSDLGIIFTQQKFGGVVNAAEIYLEGLSTAPDAKGPFFNYATWESAIYSLAHANEQREFHRKLYPTKLPEFKPKLKTRGLLHHNDVARVWCIPFQSADRVLALRTQRFLYDKYNERPAQVQVYATFKSFVAFLMMIVTGIFLTVLSRCACGRKLLLKYPGLFTYGIITHENPNPEVLKSLHAILTIKASGWTEKLAKPTDKYTRPPNKKVITKITVVSPGHEGTSIMAILSAITILNETDKIPDNGGVLTPGSAFGKTSLIEQLIKQEQYIKFEVISSTEE